MQPKELIMNKFIILLKNVQKHVLLFLCYTNKIILLYVWPNATSLAWNIHITLNNHFLQQCRVLNAHELCINGCRNSCYFWCKGKVQLLNFFPTTYPSNNPTVTSNQGLSVAKTCVHYILLQRKIGLVQQHCLWEWQKEFEIFSMLVKSRQFMIPEWIQN